MEENQTIENEIVNQLEENKTETINETTVEVNNTKEEVEEVKHEEPKVEEKPKLEEKKVETQKVEEVKVEEKKKEEEKLGETKPRRNMKYKDKLLETPFEGVYTLNGIFKKSAEKNAKRPCMGYRPLLQMSKIKKKMDDGTEKDWEVPEYKKMEWQTYEEVDKLISEFSSGMVSLTGAKYGDIFGIYEETRKEWMQFAQACWTHGITVATCYANLGLDALVHVINECEISTMLCNGSSIKTLESIQSQCKSLKYLICLDKIAKETDKFKVYHWDDVLKEGQKKEVKPEKEANKDTLAVIMYTSGSTGMPKGVMCAHKNIVAVIASAMAGFAVSNEDVYIGYLPLAHILELVAENAMICSGAAIGYGTPRTLTDTGAKPHGDLKAVCPTIMAGVPRVYDTIKKGIMGKVAQAGGLKKYLFETAFGWKLPLVSNNETSPFWDWLVFSKFAPEIGGRLRLMISGGAPLSKETMEFLKVCFGCTVIQGYGLTETCGGCSFQDPFKFSTGNVGIPIGSNEVKLVDVPDMGYRHTDKNPRGEICIRGNNISLGYYKDEKKTKESFDEDGWFHTGDVGQWNENGTLSIIDRKKNLVKMAHGEYVALENLESIFGNSPFVAPNGLCMYGDSYRNNIVAVMLPNQVYLREWAKEKGINDQNLSDLASNKTILKAVIDSFHSLGAKYNKKKFEYIMNVRIVTGEWTPENGLLTAAMKLKRQEIVKFYKKEIDEMYKELKEE